MVCGGAWAPAVSETTASARRRRRSLSPVSAKSMGDRVLDDVGIVAKTGLGQNTRAICTDGLYAQVHGACNRSDRQTGTEKAENLQFTIGQAIVRQNNRASSPDIGGELLAEFCAHVCPSASHSSNGCQQLFGSTVFF